MTLRIGCAVLFVLSGSLLWLGCDDSRSCDADDDCFSGEICIDQICAPDPDKGVDASDEDASNDDTSDDGSEDADTSTTGRTVTKVDTGDKISCALFNTGEVYCWGLNENGLLNIDSSLDETQYPTRVGGIPAAIDLEVGHDFACIRSDANEVHCWGENWGFVSGAADEQINPPTEAPVDGIAELRVGSTGGCGLLEDLRTLYCWGTAPPPPDFSQDIIDFAVGAFHGCAVVTDGDVRCWGGSSYLQIGEDDPIRGISDVRTLDAARGYNCAIKNDGTVWCWGENFDGTLGTDPDDQSSSRTPIQVPGIDDAVEVSTGRTWACAVRDGGRLSCWGEFAESDGAYEEFHAPMTIQPLISGVVDVESGNEISCALKDGGEVWCWGDNHDGQLGNHEVDGGVRAEPVRVLFDD
jgi:alpha-tubulin suppressor-like RCC1 family protein